MSPDVGVVSFVAVDSSRIHCSVSPQGEVEPRVFSPSRFHSAYSYWPALFTQGVGTVVKYTYNVRTRWIRRKTWNKCFELLQQILNDTYKYSDICRTRCSDLVSTSIVSDVITCGLKRLVWTVCVCVINSLRSVVNSLDWRRLRQTERQNSRREHRGKDRMEGFHSAKTKPSFHLFMQQTNTEAHLQHRCLTLETAKGQGTPPSVSVLYVFTGKMCTACKFWRRTERIYFEDFILKNGTWWDVLAHFVYIVIKLIALVLKLWHVYFWWSLGTLLWYKGECHFSLRLRESLMTNTAVFILSFSVCGGFRIKDKF